MSVEGAYRRAMQYCDEISPESSATYPFPVREHLRTDIIIINEGLRARIARIEEKLEASQRKVVKLTAEGDAGQMKEGIVGCLRQLAESIEQGLPDIVGRDAENLTRWVCVDTSKEDHVAEPPTTWTERLKNSEWEREVIQDPIADRLDRIIELLEAGT